MSWVRAFLQAIGLQATAEQAARVHKDFTSRAVAYVKAAEPDDARGPVVSIDGQHAPIIRDLGNGLLVTYVVDTGTQFEYVQRRHLTGEACGDNELHTSSIANLERMATGSLQIATHPNGEMFAALMGGNFEASLILLDSLWEKSFRHLVSGQYVAAIPARDLLAFCDAASAVGLQELRTVCDTARASGADHPISDQLYCRVGNQWQVFKP
jgi:uncharacterized protein YtpQ (UPF0354 family)